MIATLDGARRTAFGWALSFPPARYALVNKDRRIAIHAVVCVVSACAIAIGAPIVPLIVAPLVLGIPHLASEARWLVVRRALPRPFVIALALFAIALAIVTGLQLSPRIEVALAAISASSALIMGSRIEKMNRQGAKSANEREGKEPIAPVGLGTICCDADSRRRERNLFSPLLLLTWRSWRLGGHSFSTVAVAVIALGLGVVVLASPSTAILIRDLAIALHGFVALGAWLVLFRRRRRFALPAIGLTLVGCAITMIVRGPIVALAFLQSVHYAVWLALIPQDGVASEGTPTFRMSARAWRRDLGLPILVVAGISSIALIALAFGFGAERTRDAYLAFARFHVWLEVVLFTFFFARRST